MAMNPDDKLRKRVQWLNTQGGFNDALVKDKIMEAATGLEIARVMKILKDLEEKKDEVKDPTAYATSALRKAGGGAQNFGGQQPPFGAPNWQSGSGGFHNFADAQEIPEEKNLQKRINWLNGAGGFQGGIVYDKIWEAAQGLEYAKVMQFLKQMEEKGPEQVRDPTAWVCSALRKAGGGSPPGPPVPQGGGFPPFGGGFAAPPMQSGGGSFVDADEKLRKRIDWMNSKGGFDGAFDHNKVAAAASGLEIQVVMKVLKEAEEKKDTLKDPTAYVSAALRKMGGGHSGGHAGFQQGASQPFPAPGFPSVSQPWQGGAGMDEDTKLRKKIGWLNNDGGFDGAIHYQKIFDSARGLEFDQVFFVLKQLEEKPRGSIRDPTGWVCAALRKAGGGDPSFNQPPGGSFGGGFPSGGGAPMDVDMDQKLRKRIGWLNNHGGFEDAINYNKVAQAAEGCNLVDVMDILKELEEKKDIVKDPTAYASAALRKRKAASGCGGVRRTIQKRTHQ